MAGADKVGVRVHWLPAGKDSAAGGPTLTTGGMYEGNGL